MEIRKEKSLKRFFFQFLMKTIFYVVAAFLLWLFVVIAVLQSNLINPANAVELQIKSWEEEVLSQERFSFDDFPQEAGYLLQENGEEQKFHLTKRQIKKASELLQSTEIKQYSMIENMVYEKVQIKNQTCVVVYYLRATFKNSILAAVFPAVEMAFLLGGLLLLILTVVFSTLRTAGKMERDIQKMQDAAAKIQEQDLDFVISWTQVRELNGVLRALEQLKDNLANSLATQWKLEQDKKKQMSALAHDIKTPLTVIEGNAQMLLESDLPEEEQEYARFIDRNAGQIHSYVKQMLELSRNEVRMEKTESIQTENFLREILQDASALANLKNVVIKQTLEKDLKQLPQIFPGNAQGLRRAFANVFSNAIRYTPEGGEVLFHAICVKEEQQNCLRCTIEDSGNGFSKEALLHAKEQFYKEDESRSEKEHYGMGLSIADQMLLAAGGKLHLENAPKGGGKVTIEIFFNSSNEKNNSTDINTRK